MSSLLKSELMKKNQEQKMEKDACMVKKYQTDYLQFFQLKLTKGSSTVL
jgi:hypothetical protein